MVELVEVDEAGRIVIPKKVREKLGINERTPLLLVTTKKGQLVLQKLDINDMADRLEEELREGPSDELLEDVRRETDEKVKAAYPAVFAGQ